VIWLHYTRYELLRTFRDRRLFLFAFGFPVILYFVIALPNRHSHDFSSTGVTAPLYYMVSLASFGTMMSMMSAGFRIAGERQVGWTRQLRITPLSVRSYMRAKVLTAYAMAAVSLGLLYICGLTLGVSLAGGRWLEMTVLILIALLPFGVLGVALGHMLTVDSVGPATGGIVSLLAVVSGTWFPVTHGFLHDVGQFVPSYWLVQAGRIGLHGQPWHGMAWAVIAGWTLLLAALGAAAYRRDSGRV
jgi:ABC-2 type transport system permease protein